MICAGKAAVAILTAALWGLLFGAQSAVAEESGSFRYVQSVVYTYTTIDHAGGRVTGGSLTGTSTVLESSGEPFAEGSNHLIACVAYGKTTEAGVDIEGACTITDASGDSWFALTERRAGDIEAGGGGEGRWKLVGSTGKFDGIDGGCCYDSNYLPGVHAVSTGNCTWQRP